MDEFIKRLESRERSSLDIAKWDERLSNAQTSRTGWDSDAETCRKIRDNELPTRGNIKNAEGFTDKFYVDNWIYKSCFWKASLLMGYDTYFDLKSIDANPYDLNRDLLEAELNFAADRIDFMRKLPDTVLDWQYFGVGVNYLQWNKRAIDNAWQTGRPESRYFDPRNIWIDDGTEQPDWSDMRYLFALSLLDVEEAKMRFPKHADQIDGYVNEYKANHISGDVEKIDLYLVQYRKKFIVKKVSIYNSATKEMSVYPIEDVEKLYIEGGNLPETMEIGDTFETEDDLWFQFFYSKSLGTNLSEPEYLGKRCSFNFLLGCRIDKDIYPRGIVWYLKDLQEISVILMTLLTIQAVKLNKATPYIEEGALTDENDFIDNRSSLNFVGQISSLWRQEHPGQDPIFWDRPDFRADIPITLNSMITESIKTASGAIDSARGEAQYSGQSGVQTAQLQAAASIFTKLDEIRWHDFLRNSGEKLKDDIANYKTHEHILFGLQEEGTIVNPNNIPQFNPDNYYCVPYVDTTPEIMKQMKADRAIQLNQAGKMSTVDMLTELNVPNPVQTYERAMAENQILQTVQLLQENPELMDAIQQDFETLQKTQNNA